ncbi:hypothetical protein [uncultured Phascolarctobacterium sp.]|uniref:hypothetical protein n=1 Tax=uncultured Phascolarctobacterium sp. TaxID=512296 RepID=UPI0025DDA9C3|nr:hypothetical protein [uncultured Phascolarctobacterium sp.]
MASLSSGNSIESAFKVTDGQKWLPVALSGSRAAVFVDGTFAGKAKPANKKLPHLREFFIKK